MKKALLAAFVAAALSSLVFAQEGHPLVGTWHGVWGPKDSRTDVTVVMNWDGKQVNGIMNPGPDSVKLQNAALDPAVWGVHFEVDIKDKTGKMTHAVADGKIDDVTQIRRTIVGTWKQGGQTYEFKLQRDF
jgi:hypothetical protein